MREYITERSLIMRAYCSGIGKTPVLCLAAGIMVVSGGLSGLGVVFFARDALGASPTQIGLVSGAWTVTYAIGCILFRPFLRKVLPRYLIMSSCLGLGALILLSTLSPSPVWLIAAFAICGLLMSLFWPPAMGWVCMGAEGHELSKTMSRFNGTWCTCAIIGPLLCGVLAEHNVVYPLLAAGIISLLAGVLVLGAALTLPRIKNDRETPATQDTAQEKSDQETVLRYPSWLGATSLLIGAGIFTCVFPVAARIDIGLSESSVGTLFSIGSIFSALGFALLGRTAFWHFRSGFIVATQLLAMLVFVGVSVFSMFAALAVLFAANGLAYSAAYNASMFHGASGAKDKTKRMAIHESLLALGLLTGSLLGSMIYQHFGAVFVYRLCAATLAASAITQTIFCLWYHLRTK